MQSGFYSHIRNYWVNFLITLIFHSIFWFCLTIPNFQVIEQCKQVVNQHFPY